MRRVLLVAFDVTDLTDELVAADEKVRAALDPDVSSGLLSDSATATTEDQCHST